MNIFSSHWVVKTCQILLNKVPRLAVRIIKQESTPKITGLDLGSQRFLIRCLEFLRLGLPNNGLIQMCRFLLQERSSTFPSHHFSTQDLRRGQHIQLLQLQRQQTASNAILVPTSSFPVKLRQALIFQRFICWWSNKKKIQLCLPYKTCTGQESRYLEDRPRGAS